MRAPDFWSAPPGLAAGLLAPLAAAWSVAARLRRAATRPDRAPVPVVCVGNLVAGGSGKTPVVLSLLGLLAGRGIAVHAVTRGYGGRTAGPVRVDADRHDARAVGDEALLLARQAPCWVARDRAAGCRAAAAAGAACIVLDDGFQNPGVAKDISLIVVDARYGFGNSRVIPAGPLREPVAAGLARAEAIVLIGDGDPPPQVARAGIPVLRAVLDPADPTGFDGRRIAAFAGIGRPEKFFAALRAAGAELATARSFADHHPYDDAEIAGLRREAERAGAGLVTTAKDWVRLPRPVRAGIEVFEVEIRWRDLPALFAVLHPVLRRFAAPAASCGKGLVSRAAR